MSEEKPKNTSMNNRNTAYVLIGIGALFLLINVLNIRFASLWPLILIALGLYLLYGRNSIGSTSKTGTFRAPLEGATAVDVELHLSVGEAEVHTLGESDDLIDAELSYRGDIDFDVSGAERKHVRLRQTMDSSWEWINPAHWFGVIDEYHWNIGLSPKVPTALDLHGGLGAATLNLAEMQLTSLRLQGGAGLITATLPASDTAYPLRLQGGVGKVELRLPAQTSANMEIQGGVGEIIIETGADSALRVDAHGGIGDVRVPGRLTQISGGDSDFEIGKTGVWESAGFAEAEHQIVIHYQGGVGSLVLR